MDQIIPTVDDSYFSKHFSLIFLVLSMKLFWVVQAIWANGIWARSMVMDPFNSGSGPLGFPDSDLELLNRYYHLLELILKENAAHEPRVQGPGKSYFWKARIKHLLF